MDLVLKGDLVALVNKLTFTEALLPISLLFGLFKMTGGGDIFATGNSTVTAAILILRESSQNKRSIIEIKEAFK